MTEISEYIDLPFGIGLFVSIEEIYKTVLMLYMAHAKNVIDYGIGKNTNPTYETLEIPDYVKKCENAYYTATEINGFIKSTDTWESLGEEGQESFTHNMLYYDKVLYRKITQKALNTLLSWGTVEFTSFLGEAVNKLYEKTNA